MIRGRVRPLAAARITGLLVGLNQKEIVMNKDRIEGSVKQAAGNIKAAAGKVLGDAKLEADGNVEVTEGKLQNVKGGLKDALKG